MDILYLIGNKAELILSAIGVIISAVALVQGSVRKSNGKNPVTFYAIAAISILFVLLVIASTFLHPAANDEYSTPAQTQTEMDNPVQTQTQTDSFGDATATQPESSVKRIVLTSCTIVQGRIDGTYAFEGFSGDVLVYRGNLYSITGESNWLTISQKLSFSYESSAQTFTFIVNELLPDGKYACEFCCMTQEETFAIEVHFQVKDGCYYGISCNELYSDGVSNIFTGTKDLFDSGL